MLGGAESVAVQSELQACPPKKVALLGVLYGCGAVPVPVRLEGSEVAHPVVAENVAGHQKGHSVQPLDSKGEDSPRPVIFFLLLDPLMELRLVFPKVVVIVLRELHVPRVVPVGCHKRAVVAVPLVVVQVLAIRVLVLELQGKAPNLPKVVVDAVALCFRHSWCVGHGPTVPMLRLCRLQRDWGPVHGRNRVGIDATQRIVRATVLRLDQMFRSSVHS